MCQTGRPFFPAGHAGAVQRVLWTELQHSGQVRSRLGSELALKRPAPISAVVWPQASACQTGWLLFPAAHTAEEPRVPWTALQDSLRVRPAPGRVSQQPVPISAVV